MVSFERLTTVRRCGGLVWASSIGQAVFYTLTASAQIYVAVLNWTMSLCYGARLIRRGGRAARIYRRDTEVITGQRVQTGYGTARGRNTAGNPVRS